MKKKSIDKNYLIIIAFCLILLFLVIPDNHLFGSATDWVSQHIIFPDYFRKLFYSTHNLFPNFSMALGAGQNIYNFSYYGLLNPIILLSYLLPFVTMKNYIIGANIILYILFGLTSYYFFKDKFANKKTSLLVTILLLCAGPVIYHFHKHFMFVDYLPFLMMGLVGVDRYFSKNKTTLLIVSIFLVIMTSYYYSFCALVTILIYAIYVYLGKYNKIHKDIFKILIPIIIGILLSSILILPTLYVLVTGRSVNNTNKLLRLLMLSIPNFSFSALLYSSYSLGMSVIAILAILFNINDKNKNKRFLAITLLTIVISPLCVYILNGTLYSRPKILIPLLPLVGLTLGDFINKLVNKEIPFKDILLAIISIGGASIITYIYHNTINPVLYVDLIVMLLIIYLYDKDYTNKKILITIFMLIALTITFYNNKTDIYVRDDNKQKLYKTEEMTKDIKDVLAKEKDVVRFNNLDNTLDNVNEIYVTDYNQDSVYSSISNKLYKDFYRKTFKNALSYRNNLVMAQSSDILFQMFMGVKYIYTDSGMAPVGYKKISNDVYENTNVMPIFYGISDITNTKLFNKLTYPYNIDTLFNSVVVDDKTNRDVTSNIVSSNLRYDVKESKNINVVDKNTYLQIKSKDYGYLVIDTDNNLDKNILVVNIKLRNTPDCSKGDLAITINGITNVLTCKEWIYKNNNKTFHYVISSNIKDNKLIVRFKKGTYNISNIDVYSISYSKIVKSKNKLSHFNLKKKDTEGNISGSINMGKNGYFVTTIPYDKGFSCYVDGVKVKTVVVNKAFLGFKLLAGKHNIKITYQAPYFKLGVMGSLIGLLLLLISILSDIKKRIDG
jgi:uncharacterized membrane protein YfhO